jgi:hypothetical protein
MIWIRCRAHRRAGQGAEGDGRYDASVPELARLFTEAANGTLIPVKNWAAFAEKNGLSRHHRLR